MNQKKQETVGVLVAAFVEEASGGRALKILKEAKNLNYVYFEEIVLIRQDADGDVHYYETGDMTKGQKSGVGFLIGGVVRILGGPTSIFGSVAKGDHPHFSKESLETLSVALKPATSAIALIRSADFMQAVLKQVTGAQIKKMVSELSAQLAAELEAGKSVALGINLSQDGLEIVEVTVNDKDDDLISIITAKNGVIGAREANEESEAIVIPETTMYDSGIIPSHDPSNPGS
ncbi:MAG: hypothetical protein IAF02_15075 [Anaerolineae bacterium]|nr:hypothetical protein [Anaerolineae bacterium]